MNTDDNFTERQRDELKALMAQAISEYFSEKNVFVRHWIIEIAKLAVAITAIGIAAKTVLAWFGFQQLMK